MFNSSNYYLSDADMGESLSREATSENNQSNKKGFQGTVLMKPDHSGNGYLKLRLKSLLKSKFLIKWNPEKYFLKVGKVFIKRKF